MAVDASARRGAQRGDRLESARGMILIQVGLALFVLTAFSAFIIDFSVIWLARAQAQNAADAGALAGATARAFDEPAGAGPLTTAAAAQTASANDVYRSAAVATVDATSACPGFAAGGGSDSCVQVNVYRDGTNASTTIPTIVANIFGATSMGVAATATAQVRFGNSTKCLKPWLVPDRFNGPDWAANLPFNPANDTYAPPTGPGGTGFGRADFGTTITLTAAATSRTFYRQLDLSGGGEADFLSFITGCAPLTYSLGDFVTWFPLPNPNPGFQGDQDTAITAVVSQDASAASGGGGTVVTSCAPSSCTCTTCANGLSALLSPRIVIIALVDPSALAANTNPLPIVNLMSMLLLPPDGTGNIRGVIVPTTGLDVTSEESVWFGTGGNTGNAFIAIPTLVR